MVKGIFVVIEGASDEPCKALGEATPLQVAKTPNLDKLASKSRIDRCYSVKEGVAPDSFSSAVSLLGYDYRNTSQGALEARGLGLKMTRGDLALRCNFCSVDGLKGTEGNILDARAGRTLSAKEAGILAKDINSNVKLPFEFEFHPTMHHKGLVVFKGGFSDNVTNADPFYRDGMAFFGVTPKVVFSKPLDEEDDSKLAANLINSFIRKSHDVLDKHPLNAKRATKGLFSANCLTCRGAGNEVAKFKKLRGSWMAVGSTPLKKGIAEACKMDVTKLSYPKMKGMDVYSNLHSGLKKTIKQSIKTLKKNRKTHDYFYIHLKETDIPGLDNKPLEKVKMIELVDKKLFGFLGRYAEKNGAKMVVTTGHTTSSRLKAHSTDAAPVLFYDSAKIENTEKRFTEEQALNGKKIVGRKLLEKTLFGK
jgi:2,3-bisphosphoglycerate-independent phosphoglycerate mutase